MITCQKGSAVSGLHVNREALSRFVAGCLLGAELASLETHVRACAACAEALAAEARFEAELQALWPQIKRPLAMILPLPVRRPPVPLRRAGRWSGLVASAGGAAAALFALVATNLVTPQMSDADWQPASAAVVGSMSAGAPLSPSWASWGPWTNDQTPALMNVDVVGRLAMGALSAVDGEGACVGSSVFGSQEGAGGSGCGTSGWGGLCRPLPAAACAAPTP